MADERKLLTQRAKYPKALGWETARAWVFNPNNDEQVRMGVERLLEHSLIGQFIEYAGKKSSDAQNTVFNWEQYQRNFERIKKSCNQELLSNFLWAIFTWAKDNNPSEKAHYLSNAVGAPDLVRALSYKGLLRAFLRELISKENPELSLPILKQTFSNIENDPQATATLVSDFIYTVRDLADETAVLAAFFEGFELKAGTGLTVSWNASPMLKAIAKSKGRPIVGLYENFIRDLFTKAKNANMDKWAEWQKAYDREFLIWRNIMQSGMFKPDISFGYTETD